VNFPAILKLKFSFYLNFESIVNLQNFVPLLVGFSLFAGH